MTILPGSHLASQSSHVVHQGKTVTSHPASHLASESEIVQPTSLLGRSHPAIQPAKKMPYLDWDRYIMTSVDSFLDLFIHVSYPRVPNRARLLLFYKWNMADASNAFNKRTSWWRSTTFQAERHSSNIFWPVQWSSRRNFNQLSVNFYCCSSSNTAVRLIGG